MTSRERVLTALNNQKPDHLSCQVHSWMDYYLKKYLRVNDQFEAYPLFKDMDWVIYAGAEYHTSDKAEAKWQVKHEDLGVDADGNSRWHESITTPDGVLTHAGASNEITGWETEKIIKNERDFEIWDKYIPLPERVNWTFVKKIKERIGDKGIVRGWAWGFGQGSPWQDFCCLFDIEPAIMAAIDKPEWVHHVLSRILEKRLTVIDRSGQIENDLIETGGGAASSTVISPDMFKEFCLPYDQKQNKAIHEHGAKTVYHLCGGLMPMLDLVVQNGTDGLETMTPPEMGGDCNLAEATRRVGDKLFFVGGFNQGEGFERGTPEKARELVRKCHAACPNGGYIISPSDHFFHGDPENIQAFVDEANNCRY